MAVQIPRLRPMQQAEERRRELWQYLNLDGSRYLLGVVVLLGLMSMIALVQTGVVATKGYAIVSLEGELTLLRRENSQLHMQQAAAHTFDVVRQRAQELGLRPTTTDQIRYVVIEEVTPPEAASEPAAAEPAPNDQPVPSIVETVETVEIDEATAPVSQE